MNEPDRYDAVVIGSGEGGKYLAWHLAESGERVAVVERRYIGGSCPNTNCLPSKNVIWSAGVAHTVVNAADFGVRDSSAAVDMASVIQRKKDMVDGLVAFHVERYRESGVELIMGTARLVAPRTVEVALNDGGTRTVAAEKLFLNLGTRPSIPLVPGLAEAAPLTNIEALDIDHVPGHLLVVGGGYVGLELGQAFRRFGSDVTIVETGSQLLGREDPDVAAEVKHILEVDGIAVVLSARIERVEGRSGEGVRFHLAGPDGAITIEGTHVLVAAGRTPNTDGIGLEEAGIELTEHGYIRVNERLETTAPATWAIGECAGSPQFTHISLDDFRVIRDILSGGNRTTANRLVPFCMFTDPPLARVGLNEREARDAGIPVRVARLPTKAVLRTRTTGRDAGFMKALVGDDDSILGFTMIGAEAGEVMAVVQVAMLGRLPYTALRDATLTHPTMAEGLNALFADVADW